MLLEEPGREEQQQTVLHSSAEFKVVLTTASLKVSRPLSLGAGLSLAHLSFHLNNCSDLFFGGL